MILGLAIVKVDSSVVFDIDEKYDPLWMPGMPRLDKRSSKTGKQICPDCGRRYQLRTSLLNHLKYECGKEAQFKCTKCKYKSKLKGNIKGHMLRRHKIEYVDTAENEDES